MNSDLDRIGKEVVVAYSRHSICYWDEGASSLVNDVHPYVIIRRLLHATYFQCSYAGGKFRHIYRGLFFRKVVYIRHDFL
jgi:hypothetical protein